MIPFYRKLRWRELFSFLEIELLISVLSFLQSFGATEVVDECFGLCFVHRRKYLYFLLFFNCDKSSVLSAGNIGQLDQSRNVITWS